MREPMGNPMRSPCRNCGGTVGAIETRGGQDCVFCDQCGSWNYNAPRVETGRKQRTIATVHEAITPRIRALVLMRASGHCEICGASPTPEHPLHVGHMLSVKRGMEQGLNETELNSLENLAALCDGCNLGIADTPVPLRLVIGIVMARTGKQGS